MLPILFCALGRASGPVAARSPLDWPFGVEMMCCKPTVSTTPTQRANPPTRQGRQATSRRAQSCSNCIKYP